MPWDDGDTVRLHIRWVDHTDANLEARIAEFRRRDRRVPLNQVSAVVHSLRGIWSRAGLLLPALYLVMAARAQQNMPGLPHRELVKAAHFEHTSLHTIAVGRRAIFDDKRKRLGGKRIAELEATSIAGVAECWGQKPSRPFAEAEKALQFLCTLFGKCARAENLLVNASSLLERRIGLLKYYANRQAAHISLEEYLFDIVDVVHVVCAIVIIGAIARHFDDSMSGKDYFDSVDEAGWQVAKELFPGFGIQRLFKSWNIDQRAEVIWKIADIQFDGIDYLLNQLPAALGYWDNTRQPIL